MTKSVPLYKIAHARSGDKGNLLNISLICYDPASYPVIRDQVTADRVKQLFSKHKPSKVDRYELPNLAAFNFVLHDVLQGGVNSSLGLDGHGKSLSFYLLETEIFLP